MRFEVGDFVYARTALEDFAAGTGMPRAMIVEATVEETCIGGTQRYYLCANTGNAVKIAESNLVLTKDVVDDINTELLEGELWVRK